MDRNEANRRILDALTRFDAPGQAETRILELVCGFAGAAAGHLAILPMSRMPQWLFHEVRWCKFSKAKFDAMTRDHNRHVGTMPVEIMKLFNQSKSVFRHTEVAPQEWLGSDYYKKFMRKHGLDDSLAMLCRNSAGKAIVGIGISFETGVRATDAAIETLTHLAPLIGQGLENLQHWYSQYARRHASEIVNENSADCLAVVELLPLGAKLLSASGGARNLGISVKDEKDNCTREFLKTCSRASRPNVKSTLWKAASGLTYNLRASVTPPLSIAPTLLVRFVEDSGSPAESGFTKAVAEYKGLSAREAELMSLLATGHSDKEIANRVKISIHTVRAHLRNIYQKLKVEGRVAAIHSVYGLGKNRM